MGDLNRDGAERYPTDEDARRQQRARDAHYADEKARVPMQAMSSSRETARQILDRRIYEAERRAIALRALSDALPLILPPDADEALWQMLVAIR